MIHRDVLCRLARGLSGPASERLSGSAAGGPAAAGGRCPARLAGAGGAGPAVAGRWLVVHGGVLSCCAGARGSARAARGARGSARAARGSRGRRAGSPGSAGWWNDKGHPGGWPLSMFVRRRPTLPRSHPRSTIGAERLSFRVRNGTGRFPLAMAAETLLRYQREPSIRRCSRFPTESREPHSGRELLM